jgi:hypothetical protein
VREHNKRWLISKMQSSGSRRDHLVNGDFSEERNTKKYADVENLPSHESIKKTRDFYNGKINTGLLVRFLRGQIGNDWDLVHSEIIARIPARLLDYKEIALWYVADKVEWKNGKLWNNRTQKHIFTGGEYSPINLSFKTSSEEFIEFYVDPETNKLVHNQHKAFKRITKSGNKA